MHQVTGAAGARLSGGLAMRIAHFWRGGSQVVGGIEQTTGIVMAGQTQGGIVPGNPEQLGVLRFLVDIMAGRTEDTLFVADGQMIKGFFWRGDDDLSCMKGLGRLAGR